MTDQNYIHDFCFDIAWGDMDALGHVNNARYFDYFQEARIDWLRSFKLGLAEETGPVVIHVACTFLKPVIYPAKLTVRSHVPHVGNSSMTMEHDVFQGEVLMAQGVSKMVWVDYHKNKPVRIPDSIRDWFK